MQRCRSAAQPNRLKAHDVKEQSASPEGFHPIGKDVEAAEGPRKVSNAESHDR